jgi:type VI protein secretion system component Hcp
VGAANAAPDQKICNLEKAHEHRPRNQTTTKELSEAELENATGGSQSSGAGAGKVTFNPFSITRKIDKSSPVLF